MIFDKNYDKTLWVIFAVSGGNRDRILEFLNSIPEELYVKVNNSLAKYKSIVDRLDNVFEELPEDYYGEFYVDDKKYWYMFLGSQMDLNVGVSTKGEDGNYYDVFDMTLTSFEYYKKLLLFSNDMFGSISYGHVSDNLSGITVDYSFYKTPLGLVVKSLCDNERLHMMNVRNINKGNIDEDISIGDLKDSKKLERVLKKKVSFSYSIHSEKQ